MSGGSLNYADSVLRSIINDIDSDRLDKKETYKPIQKEVVKLRQLLFYTSEVIHALEWYTSGDTDKEDFLTIYKEFSKIWLKENK